jgi:uncharacterized protein
MPTDNSHVALLVCSNCHYKQLPDSLDPFREPGVGVCPNCLQSDLQARAGSGAGTVLTFAWYLDQHLSTHLRPTPYNVAYIELDEGPLLFAGVDEVGLEDLRIGQRVKAIYRDDESLPCLRFIALG